MADLPDMAVNHPQEVTIMKTLDTTIRLETPADYAAVEHLVRECF